jgi:hypothetical protein
MTKGNFASLFMWGLAIVAFGVLDVALRKRIDLTTKEIWRYDAGLLVIGKFLIVSGLILTVSSGTGWVLKSLNVW